MTTPWTQDDILNMEVRPIGESTTIPARWFTSPQFHQLDKERILAKSWMYAGHESQISEPGSFMVDEILGRPILLVRSNSGEIHCFSNVCRHRGGPIAKASGSARMLRCAYHAWTYDLEGHLVGTPKFDGVQNFNKKECSLPRYRMDVYGGFIFVNFSGDAPDLSEHLQGIKERIAPIDLDQMRFKKRIVYEVKANWKVYIDNYMEGYHILPVHPGLAKILDVSGYTTSADGPRVLQYGPLADGDNLYHTDGAAYYYQVFPNLMLNILPGRVQVNSILPLDADRCLTVFDYYYSEEESPKLQKRIEDDLLISDQVQKEDIEICELVQKGLQSGTYDKGRISPSEELGVWVFQNNLRIAYDKIRLGTHSIK